MNISDSIFSYSHNCSGIIWLEQVKHKNMPENNDLGRWVYRDYSPIAIGVVEALVGQLSRSREIRRGNCRAQRGHKFFCI